MMKSLTAIANFTFIFSLVFVLVFLGDKHSVQAHHFLVSPKLIANAKTSEQIVAIINLQPGKIQQVSGFVEALCDDEFILRDDTSPLVVKVDLKAQNIQLFQGEELTVIGIYYDEKLEAFEIKKANGTLIKLNSANTNLL